MDTESNLSHFAARFFDAPVPGQIGPQDRIYVLYAKSLSAAKRAAKALRAERGHIRLVEVFLIPVDEHETFKRNGWYANALVVLTAS